MLSRRARCNESRQWAARAEAAWTSENPGRCAEEASAAYSLAVEHEHAWFLGELAYWQWKAGALESIPPAAAEPYLLQMSGKWETAEAAWDAKGCRYEAARALEESGDEDAMKKALRMFDLLGARPAMAMTIKSLRNLGARHIPRGPRPSTRGNPANLTGREADVLDLLMAGRTNRAIAEALFLSPKTVERHVSAILAKLDASTRQEAVARARELGISTSPN